MKTFSIRDRETNLDRLAEEDFDLAIIGGGITGAGVARDAASRGMKVALIEARDFAFGTSSRSSKLVHGGIRYLENMEFGLVFEALNERQLLFEIAPHLVHPLRFLLPLYNDSRVGMFKMGLGMWLYDALSLFNAPELHERLDRNETMGRIPVLKSNGLAGSYVYSDAYMDDDRLVIETLRAANELGACAVNYTEVQAGHFSVEDGRRKLDSLSCVDKLTGRSFTLRAKHFVGSVGPWTDRLGKDLFSDWKKWLRPSKGIHLTLDRNRLPLKQAVVMAADAEKRIVFAIPRHEMIIIGTTDTDFKEDPAEVGVQSADVRYLLKIASEYFPGARLTASDCLASYAGVRPLVDDGSATESGTSREHKIWTDPSGITFVAGGKYTTYRHMAAEIVDECLEYFPLEQRVRLQHSNTKVPLNPLASVEMLARAQAEVIRMATDFDINECIVRQLADKHGMETETLLTNCRRLGLPADLWLMEAYHSIENEMCLTLLDFYTRRSRLFLAYKDQGLGQLEAITEVFSHYLGWGVDKQSQEMESVRKYIASELAWKKDF